MAEDTKQYGLSIESLTLELYIRVRENYSDAVLVNLEEALEGLECVELEDLCEPKKGQLFAAFVICGISHEFFDVYGDIKGFTLAVEEILKEHKLLPKEVDLCH